MGSGIPRGCRGEVLCEELLKCSLSQARTAYFYVLPFLTGVFICAYVSLCVSLYVSLCVRRMGQAAAH